MPLIPTRFPVEFGEVFPFGAFVLGVEPSMAFSADPSVPKVQERDKETGQLVWVVRAIDANEEAAKYGAEFKVKVAADHQPVPPAKLAGFPFAPVEFDGLTITPYANQKGRIAHSFRASGLRAPAGAGRGKPAAEKPAA
ncbi:MAG: plasmid replication, integration and excision activator [Actinophytocola sp.]|uniref:plasmid replication, integration and excision activator n=1 Tax=Actinophytocola sp. TaxID=1872138 RepID=UPI00132461D2|nr:plasmid replication, integration and excision activator [Actinophytocola sp.]MPZ83428.1 plasmid replication, integration and excision activator [Actinophytocola sp.]